MNEPSYRGSLPPHLCGTAPSLHLAKLINIIAKIIDENKSKLDLFALQDKKLIVNTRPLLSMLFRDPEFHKEFGSTQGGGFVRDMKMPPRGTTARVGGRLLHGTQPYLTKNIEHLHQGISELLDKAIRNIDPAELTLSSMEDSLQKMANSLRERKPSTPSSSRLVSISFTNNERNTHEQKNEIGKVFTAIETVEDSDWLELLCKGIANLLRNQDMEDEIDGVIGTIKSKRNNPGSQLNKFFEFLEEGALARARLQVALNLMEALAHHSAMPAFKAYVGRIVDCFRKFASINGKAIVLDPSKCFGQASITNLSEQLQKTVFYSCLPVWVEGSAQLFETRTSRSAFMREISYRFRINGKNPQTGKRAFESRLDRLQESLGIDKPEPTNPKEPSASVQWNIAELTFLYLVVPENSEINTEFNVESTARQIAEWLKKDPISAIRHMHDALTKRDKVMSEIAIEMISMLRSKSRKIIAQANSKSHYFMVSIHRDILNMEVFYSMGNNNDILVKHESGNDAIEWFKHITVSQEAQVHGSILSFVVKTELMERLLAVSGPDEIVSMKHDMSSPVLNIRFVPYRFLNKENQWVPDIPDASYFDTCVGIDVQYDLQTIGINREHHDQKEKEKAEQFRAATICALTVTLYVILWEVQRRARASKPNVGLNIIRLQHIGRKFRQEDDAKNPNTAIYAISQALEKALAREGHIKLQGLTTLAESITGEKQLPWKRRGALQALLGGQPMRFTLEGALNRIALLTYVTRPCDTHPSFPNANGYIFLSRTYVAERQEHDALLRAHRMRCRLVENRQEFKNPQPILEEIARLREDGFQHIMLLSHHFGNRHIGRAAERHAPHGTLEFLDAVMQRFPDLHLYPLRRDVFPATRIHIRERNESGFEVKNFKDHQDMYTSIFHDLMRSVIPIYTFATLAVVGEDGERPQSGFCTYFYDVEQRISNIKAAKTAEMNILGIGEADETRKSLISVLRAIHFMESEKPSLGNILLPVLDPYGWTNPERTAQAGEVEIMRSRHGRSVLLSLPAMLTHVTKVLHKEDI